MMSFPNYPDWAPFACLISAQPILRKGMLTRAIELLLASAVGGVVSLSGAYYWLKSDLTRLETQQAAYEKFDTERFAERTKFREAQIEVMRAEIREVKQQLLVIDQKIDWLLKERRPKK